MASISNRTGSGLAQYAEQRTDETPADISRDLGEMFLHAEQSGLKLAIIIRTVTLVLLGAWLVGTRAQDPIRALGYAVVLTIFAALGLIHYVMIGTRFDQRWVKYVFVTLDIAIVSALVATRPLYATAIDLPAVTTFRAPIFTFYFVILGLAALSFFPGLVLGPVSPVHWAGSAPSSIGEAPCREFSTGATSRRIRPPSKSWRSCSTPNSVGSAAASRRRSRSSSSRS